MGKNSHHSKVDLAFSQPIRENQALVDPGTDIDVGMEKGEAAEDASNVAARRIFRHAQMKGANQRLLSKCCQSLVMQIHYSLGVLKQTLSRIGELGSPNPPREQIALKLRSQPIYLVAVSRLQ